MPDSVRYIDWFEKAKSDYSAAGILLEHEGLNSIVCFHSQQAIEKAMKGFILKEGKQLIEGHNLVFLCRKAAEFDGSLTRYLKDCAFVNQFYVETRYPADIPLEVEDSDAQACIAIAGAVLDSLINAG